MLVSGTVNFKGSDLWVEADVEPQDYSNAHDVYIEQIQYKGTDVKDLVMDSLLDANQISKLENLIIEMYEINK
jgi:hypothetical protein